jgi:hypothetical protein
MAKFTLGGLMAKLKIPAMPKVAAAPRVAKIPAARRGAGTLALKRLPLAKVRTGPGY